MQLPVEDKFYATKNEMKENIVHYSNFKDVKVHHKEK